MSGLDELINAVKRIGCHKTRKAAVTASILLYEAQRQRSR
jgi:hypothetical protein